MEGLIQLGIFLFLLLLGYVFGTLAEKRHYKSIREREFQYRRILVLTGRTPPSHVWNRNQYMVSGNVVVSVDYFKKVIAALRNLVGGRVSSYESLLDRARREAVLRMQEEAQALGADMVVNLKFETSNLSGNASKKLGAIEVLAYGTAMENPAAPAVAA